MELKALKALTAAALLAATTAATAGTAPFNMVSGATAPGVDVSLSIQQSSTPGYDYDFVVSNSSLMGIVTGVYFEMDWSGMLGAASDSGPATLLPGNHTPQIDGWEGTKSSHTVEKKSVRKLVGRHYVDYHYDNLDHGVQEGASQVFSFNAHSDFLSLADLESMLGTEGYGVAIKMQGLTADEQASGWGLADEREEEILVVQSLALVREVEPNGGGNGQSEVTAVPSPTAAFAGLVLAGIAGLRRRRK
jgi:MYXO-CTERM domain-containing protein